MSADNGIYILQSKDGIRVAHCQAIENIYWWSKKCCKKQDIEETTGMAEGIEVDVEKCKNCGKVPGYEQRTEINPKVLKGYFGNSKVFKIIEEALKEATRQWNEVINDPICPICEYGISYIKGWEKKNFPK